MKLSINRESFEAIRETERGVDGTVEISIGSRTLRANATKFDSGHIRVDGFIGRYRTSDRPWIASVVSWGEDDIYVNFGRDDRSGRFHKRNAISWEPELFERLTSA